MKIELDTNELTTLDRQLLDAIAETINSVKATSGPEIIATDPTPASAPGTATAPVTQTPAPVKKAAQSAKVEPKQAEPVPTSEEATDGGEDLIAPADSANPAPAVRTMSDAVAAATTLVSSGQSAKVKEALSVVGVKRVSEIPAESIELFLTTLEA